MRQLHDSLWVIDAPLELGRAEFGTRTSVIRLSDGSLFVHSPGPPDEVETKAVTALGPVRFIVAPNKMHHFFVAAAAEAFPDASVYLAPGLAEKKPDLPCKGTLGDDAPDEWKADLDQTWIRGMPRLDEVAFLHRTSRTLLLTDVCFNFGTGGPWWTRTFLRVAGAYDRFGPSRIARRLMRDKAAVRSAIDRILAWDFDRVIVTHGDVLETGGHEALRRAFESIS